MSDDRKCGKYGEPWEVSPEEELVKVDGLCSRPVSSAAEGEDAPRIAVDIVSFDSVGDGTALARRVTSCLNALAGVPDNVVEQLARVAEKSEWWDYRSEMVRVPGRVLPSGATTFEVESRFVLSATWEERRDDDDGEA